MDSLYGGKPGISFILKASFLSVSDMVAAFKQGATYTAVWYGEYVIIDTPNKNDKDNGKIYRRGLDYQNTLGGAEYIGQVVGPSSGTPYFSFDTIPSVQAKAQEPLPEYSYKRYPTGRDAQGKYITSDGNGKNIASFELTTKDALVPGKDGNTFHDSIKYTWLNIRMDNADADSWFYVGFEIPYMVIDFEVHSTSPYDNLGNRRDLTTMDRIDDKTHPFWENWDIGIPKGIKGDALRNLRVITPKTGDVIYTFENITTTVDLESGNFHTSLGTPGYPGQQEDITNGYQILVFDYYYFDNHSDGDKVTVYVADYKIVSAIYLDDDGTLRLAMTHDGQTRFEKKIKWIDLVSLTSDTGSDGGHFRIDYNNGTPSDEFLISWMKAISIDNNGSVTYTFAGETQDIPYGATRVSDGVYTAANLITWIRSIDLNPNTGEFVVTNNRGGEMLRVTLDWISDIYIDEATGEIALRHTDASQNTGTAKNGQQAEILEARLKLITGATISDNGIITLVTNTGEIIQLLESNGKPFQLQKLIDVELDTGINADKRIKILYNTSTDWERIGDPLNYIQDMVVRTTDWHLLVLYSDPTKRPTADDLNDGVDAEGHSWVNNIRGTDGTNYGINVYWEDMGAIKDQAGILIGLNVREEQVKQYLGISTKPTRDQVCQYLDSVYTDGLTGANNLPGGMSLQGKIVTYTATDSDDVEFYAFNYETTDHEDYNWKWYYLGKFSDSGMRDARLTDTSVTGQARLDIIATLNTNGLLFRTTTLNVVDNLSNGVSPIPKYWESTYDQWI